MRFINTETGEIIDAIVISDVKRFRKTQKRLTRQSMPLWKLKRKRYQQSRNVAWYLKLMHHL